MVPLERSIEALSRSIFEETVTPWPVTPWTMHDYGMDALVDVLRPRDDGLAGHFYSGRRIAVQLKGSEQTPPGSYAAVQVNVRTLRCWLGSHDPFALVFCQVKTRRLAYRWVDDDLVADLAARDPSWFTKESITVRVPLENVLSGDRLDEIDREARRVVLHRHRVLAPGTYHRLEREAADVMDDVARAATSAGFASVATQIVEAQARVRNATYVVALAGRMRAGKSTLFNALARREISPVARRPTTAVPIFVTAGESDAATVVFLDGRTAKISATAKALAEYATQDDNPDNKKRVRVVTVQLVSERLERGIAIVDAPGLFDPSAEIRDITARTLASANAVLFVMDVSSARSGGFAVESHVLDELRRAIAHSERVFLLLNKADELGEADREDVLNTLSRALARAGLSHGLTSSPVFISAKAAWEWATAGAESESPIAELEEQIWDYLLRTNSTGVARLEVAVQSSVDAIDAGLTFVALRRATSAQVRAIQDRLGTARGDIATLQALCASTKGHATRTTDALLREGLEKMPTQMGEEMRASRRVLSKEAIGKAVCERVEAILRGVWEVALRELGSHSQEVSERLQAALEQVRLDHEVPAQPTIAAPSLVIPAFSLLSSEAVGFGVLGGMLTLAIAPAYAIAVTFGSFLLGAILGKEKQLAREIARVEKTIRSQLADSVSRLSDELRKSVDLGYERLDRYVRDRWAVFEKDALNQVSRAGTPLSTAEVAELRQLELDLVAARHRLKHVAEEIRWTPTAGPELPQAS